MRDPASPATEIPDLDRRLLHELEPEAGRLFDRHLKMAQEWFPHEYIPYRLGRDSTRSRGPRTSHVFRAWPRPPSRSAC